jgi:glutathione S-transferase
MPTLMRVTREVSNAVVSAVVDRETTLGRKLLLLGGFTGSGLRLAAGTVVTRLGPRPQEPMTLWDFERCPHSRLVREALSALDLDAHVRPCPRGGTRFRPELDGGRVPRLKDPNAHLTIVGSRDIVKHLYARYGAGKPPGFLHLPVFTIATGLAMRLLTGQRGGDVRPSKPADKPLELWSFEASPYCRRVRALLCELELPYLLHSVAKGSPRRDTFVKLSGKMQLPFLKDPNTGAELFESLHIERYLESTYGVAPALSDPRASG